MESPHLGALESLKLWGLSLDEEGLALLAGSSRMGALEGLSLTWCLAGAAALRALGDGGGLPSLKHLTLAYAPMGAEGAGTLARCPLLPRLESLDLWGTQLDERAIALLAESGALANLRRFNVSHCRFGAEGVAAVASVPFRSLRELRLAGIALGVEGCRALARSHVLASLDRLDLGRCKLTALEAEALASSGRPDGPIRLDLDENGLGDGGVAPLAGSPLLSRLRTLSLRNNGLKNRDIKALAGSPHLAELRTLDMNHNHLLTDPSARYLAGSPYLKNLRRLGLWDSRLTREGYATLAASPRLPHLLAFTVPERPGDMERPIPDELLRAGKGREL